MQEGGLAQAGKASLRRWTLWRPKWRRSQPEDKGKCTRGGETVVQRSYSSEQEEKWPKRKSERERLELQALQDLAQSLDLIQLKE